MSKRTALSPEAAADKPFAVCTLPPHGGRLEFRSLSAYEEHYRLTHQFLCRESGCGRTFPSAHLLDLHQVEEHSVYTQLRQERGQRTYHCLVEDCERRFKTPKLRRLHCVDKHGFPRPYFWGITRYGIGDLVDRYGPAVSLVRPDAYHPQPQPSTQRQDSPPPSQSNPRKRKEADYSDEDDDQQPPSPVPQTQPAPNTDADADDLAQAISTLTLIPHSVARKARQQAKQHEMQS